jgi:hypothetical protein
VCFATRNTKFQRQHGLMILVTRGALGEPIMSDAAATNSIYLSRLRGPDSRRDQGVGVTARLCLVLPWPGKSSCFLFQGFFIGSSATSRSQS